ncbi:MAG: hypothetical protein ACFFD6_01925 [Candidatus Thorarchaeota archaeon]
MTGSRSSIWSIIEDISVSFKFAFKNLLSFFLGMIGILVMTLLCLVMMLALFFVTVVFLLPNGVWDLIDVFIAIIEAFGNYPEPTSLGLVVLVLVPLVLPLFVAIGALYGMAREIVESEGASAEGVFTWYSSRFFSLAGGGIIIFLVTIVPIAFLYAYAYQTLGGVITGTNETIVIVTAVMWFIITSGLLSMMFPAIIDGMPVLQAAGTSVKMGVKYLDRVFSVWIFFLVLIVALISPLIWPYNFYLLFGTYSLGAYPAGAILLILFIVIPALAIAQSRVYLLVSSEEDEIPVTDENTHDIDKWGARN